jgi:enterochelin esterase family protein
MNNFKFVSHFPALLLTFALAAGASPTTCIAASIKDPENNGSARLLALARDLNAGDRQVTAPFWKEIEGKAPLVESVATNTTHRRVTFLWRGTNDTSRVSIIGGFPGANLAKPMRRLADSDVWYLTETHASEARFGYVFQVNGPETLPMTDWRALMKELGQNSPRPDPLNPRAYAGWSYVELPDAPPQPWVVKKDGVPTGQQTKEKVKSQILNAEYPLNIFTPAGYEKNGERCWLMIAFDGGFSTMDITLDNLRAAGRIPPVVVVGVGNINGQTRKRDLDCSDDFARFLATELVPWARKNLRVSADPAQTIVGGSSLGGKMAAYCGLKYSGIFGKVLSQSGSFLTAVRQESPPPLWDAEAPGMLAAEFAQSPRLPLEFYIEAGRYETTLPFSPLLETRRLRDVLQSKGYRVTYSEFVGGHNEICWRGSFAEGIMALTAVDR